MMNRIKQYRLAAGLTPADISAMFKIPYRTVQKWEKGELVPPGTTIYVTFPTPSPVPEDADATPPPE